MIKKPCGKRLVEFQHTMERVPNMKSNNSKINVRVHFIGTTWYDEMKHEKGMINP